MFEDIKNQFIEVIRYSQDIINPEVDSLFEQWYEAKSHFINNLFNGELIYQYPEKIKFSLSDSEKEKNLNRFTHTVYYNYGEGGKQLSQFLDVNKQGFFNNTVEVAYEYGKTTIPKGMKLVKAFKYFIEDREDLDDLQSEASRIIQEDKIEGYLCFSVHPLDYLSLSENTYNWRSCHALDGEYRAGNLSYMGDGSTIICYLKSDEDKKLPRFPESVPWNSKKWRMLLNFSTNYETIFAGRQYPMTIGVSSLGEIRDILIKLFNDDLDWSLWSNVYLTNDINIENENFNLVHDWFPMNGRLYEKESVIQDCKYPLHYNDLLRSSYYTKPYYMNAVKNTWVRVKTPKIKVGSEVSCLCCGSLLEESQTMICDDCDNYDNIYYHCELCNKSIVLGQNSFDLDNCTICEDCLSQKTLVCSKCGRKHLKGYYVHSGIEEPICFDCSSKEEEKKIRRLKRDICDDRIIPHVRLSIDDIYTTFSREMSNETILDTYNAYNQLINNIISSNEHIYIFDNNRETTVEIVPNREGEE